MNFSATGSPTGELTRALVLRHGWTSTVYQILNPGIDHWFSAGRDGVVGYVTRNGVRVVAGAPVCDLTHLAAVTEEFEADAREQGERVCYFGAEGRIEALYRDDPGHSLIPLGAMPSWDPGEWVARVHSHASVRAQLSRARNKGVQVAEWAPQRAEQDAGLRGCLADWLATRGLPPLHFLVEPETLRNLRDRRVFVAERAGSPVAFLVASPIPTREGWLVEQVVRGREAPNGTAELMIDAAVRAVGDDGARYLTLGLAPLSQRAGATGRDPWWLGWLFGWARAHGRRFYNFDGLDRFKAKFNPGRWEPVYAVSNEASFSVGSLYAIAEAFTGGPPLGALLRGVGRAIAQEARWLRSGRQTDKS